MMSLFNISLILIISMAIISCESACTADDSSAASSSSSSSSTSSQGSSTSSSSSSSSSSTGSGGCSNCCYAEPKCRCFDIFKCPLEYKNVCAFNGQCYKSFRSKCEVRYTNENAKPGDRKWKAVVSTRCENDSTYIPLCKDCVDCTPVVNQEVCAYSCQSRCYRNFNSRCQLDQHNCYNLNDPFSFYGNGRCNANLAICKR